LIVLRVVASSSSQFWAWSTAPEAMRKERMKTLKPWVFMLISGPAECEKVAHIDVLHRGRSAGDPLEMP
jgi:uncharacterized protein (UPF0128 family)